jgi:hypothetical protein
MSSRPAPACRSRRSRPRCKAADMQPPRSLRSLPQGPRRGPCVAQGARQCLRAAGRH